MPVIKHPAGGGEDGHHHQHQLQPVLGQVAPACVQSGTQVYLRQGGLDK